MKKAEKADAYYNKQPAKMNTYEASEGVKDMPIKQTEESHKKCSPGEFCMHKEGARAFGKRAADMFADERAMVEKAPLLPTGTPMPGHVWDLTGGKVQLRPDEVRDWEAVPQLPERSELTDELAWQKQHRNEEARSRAIFQNMAPPVLETAGGLVGSKPGAMAGKMLGQGLSVAAPFLDAYANRQDARNAMITDTDKATAQMQPAKMKPPMNPAAFQRRPFDEPGSPPVPKQLPAGQPRPPVVQPPRGLGSAMGKASAFKFGQKLANDWMGLSSSRNGPGGLISEKTLPKADATAKNWGAAQPPVPPPSLATRVAVPSSQQQYNDMAQAHPGLKQISPNMQQNMLNRISQGGEYNSQAQAPSLQDAGRAIGDHLKMFGEGAQNIGTQMRNSPGIKQVLDAVPRGGPTPAPTQPQQRVNPYDDPNYDHYNKPGLDPIKHMLNFARPARKALQPAL